MRNHQGLRLTSPESPCAALMPAIARAVALLWIRTRTSQTPLTAEVSVHRLHPRPRASSVPGAPAHRGCACTPDCHLPCAAATHDNGGHAARADRPRPCGGATQLRAAAHTATGGRSRSRRRRSRDVARIRDDHDRSQPAGADLRALRQHRAVARADHPGHGIGRRSPAAGRLPVHGRRPAAGAISPAAAGPCPERASASRGACPEPASASRGACPERASASRGAGARSATPSATARRDRRDGTTLTGRWRRCARRPRLRRASGSIRPAAR
jgi:hypothetical protein